MSNASGFPAHCLIGSTYILLGGPGICNSVFQFRKRTAIFGCRSNPGCHSLCPRPPPPKVMPSYTRNNILNILPNVVNIVRTGRAVGIVLNTNGALDNHLLLCGTLSVAFQRLGLHPGPIHPMVSGLVSCRVFYNVPRTGTRTRGSLTNVPRVAIARLGRILSDKTSSILLLSIQGPGRCRVTGVPNSILIPLPSVRGNSKIDRIGRVLGNRQLVIRYGVNKHSTGTLNVLGRRNVANAGIGNNVTT